MKLEVLLVVAIGQSNMSGRGMPVPSGEAQYRDYRLLQFPRSGPSAGRLCLATDPLNMPDSPKGVGPALGFARHLLNDRPESKVVVIPAAVGGTALSTDHQLGWRWGVPGNLADLAVRQTLAAVNFSKTAFPEFSAKVASFLWLQGESDAAMEISGEVHRADLECLVERIRKAVAAPAAPFVIGQMAVEGMGTGTHKEIDRAHRATARSLPAVAISRAPLQRHRGDRVHFTAAGQRVIATRMYRAFRRALHSFPSI